MVKIFVAINDSNETVPFCDMFSFEGQQHVTLVN